MKPAAPLFLARRAYVARRLGDAARILPIIAGFLLVLPGLWQGGTTRHGVVYLFSIWIGLIVATVILSRLLSRFAEDFSDQPDDSGGDG